MPTTRYPVTGMTCEHCAGAVTTELQALAGVEKVEVELAAGGTSMVTIFSTKPLSHEQVTAALDEAGDYRLAGTR